jgi:hypothetical protein
MGPTRAAAIAAFAAFLAWALATAYGRGLPYLITENSRELRTFVLFPAILGLLGWAGFRHRWKSTGMTGYEQAMRELSRREKLVLTLKMLAGLLFLPAGVSWLSVYLAACVAKVSAEEPLEQTYAVMDIRRVRAGDEFQLSSVPDGEDAWLYWRGREAQKFRSDRRICLHGRTSFFGTIIDSIESSDCKPKHLPT